MKIIYLLLVLGLAQVVLSVQLFRKGKKRDIEEEETDETDALVPQEKSKPQERRLIRVNRTKGKEIEKTKDNVKEIEQKKDKGKEIEHKREVKPVLEEKKTKSSKRNSAAVEEGEDENDQNTENKLSAKEEIIRKPIRQITKKRLSNKQLGELNAMIGGLNLNELPLDSETGESNDERRESTAGSESFGETESPRPSVYHGTHENYGFIEGPRKSVYFGKHENYGVQESSRKSLYIKPENYGVQESSRKSLYIKPENYGVQESSRRSMYVKPENYGAQESSRKSIYVKPENSHVQEKSRKPVSYPREDIFESLGSYGQPENYGRHSVYQSRDSSESQGSYGKPENYGRHSVYQSRDSFETLGIYGKPEHYGRPVSYYGNYAIPESSGKSESYGVSDSSYERSESFGGISESTDDCSSQINDVEMIDAFEYENKANKKRGNTYIEKKDGKGRATEHRHSRAAEFMELDKKAIKRRFRKIKSNKH